MIYRLPRNKDKNSIHALINEFILFREDYIKRTIHYQQLNFSQWLSTIDQMVRIQKEYILLCFENNILIGILIIRCNNDSDLVYKSGNIGFYVRPTMRKNGYGLELLLHAIKFLKKIRSNRIVVGCYSNNIPSLAVIRKAGGKFITKNNSYKKGKSGSYFIME